MTGQQLCDMLQDGEIMSYINKIPIRRDELGAIFQAMGDACDMRKTMAPGVRQKKLAPLVVQLSKIVKEYETANLVETERKQKDASNAALIAQAEANRKAAENRQREANAAVAAEAEAAAKAAANAQLRNAQAAAEMAVANVSGNLSTAENSALTLELKNFKNTINKLSSRLNKAIQNSRATRNISAAAARRGGSRRRNTHTRKARNARKA